MTDLTKKWKKGELPRGWYYVVLDNKETNIALCKDVFTNCGRKLKRDFAINDVIEVLAPVPSYDEYLESEAHCAVYSEENKLLKQFVNLYSHETEVTKQLYQLLKECKEYLSDVDTYCTKNADESYLLITRINAVIGESEG